MNVESKAQHLLLGIWEVSVLGGKWECVMASFGLLRLAMIYVEATFSRGWKGFGASDGCCSLIVMLENEKR